MKVRLATLALLGAGTFAACSADLKPWFDTGPEPDAGVEGGLPDVHTGVDAGVPELPEPPPLTAAELASASERLLLPGVELLEVEGQLTGLSGRLSPNNNRHALLPQEAAARFVEEYGATAWGWAGTQPHVAVVQPEREPWPVEKKAGTSLRQLHAVQVAQLCKGVPIETRQATVLVGSEPADPGFAIGGFYGRLGAECPSELGATPALPLNDAVQRASTDPRLQEYLLGGIPLVLARFRGKLVWREVRESGSAPWLLAYRVLSNPGELTPLPALSLLIDANTGALIEVIGDEQRAVTVTREADLLAPFWTGLSPRSVRGAEISYSGTSSGAGFALARRYAPQTGSYFVEDGARPFTSPTAFFLEPAYTPLRFASDAFMHAGTVFSWFKERYDYLGWNATGTGDLAIVPRIDASWGASLRTADARLILNSGASAERHPAGTGLSIVAHELGHLILSATNPLQYTGESGALNEALADFTAQAVRGFASDYIGDDTSVNGRVAVRNYANPRETSQPDLYRGEGFVAPSNPQSLHTNSGVLNRAHHLVVRGSGEQIVNGYAVPAFSPVLDSSVQQVSNLVFSALLSHAFAETTTLPEYAAGLYSFCRAQLALWPLLPLTTTEAAGCESVRRAFAATGLLYGSRSPNDLALVQATTSETPLGADVLRLLVTASNAGATPYDGPLRVDLRSTDGTLVLGTAHGRVLLPGRTGGTLELVASVGSLASQLPYDTRLTISASPGADLTPSNDTATFRLFGDILPAGTRADLRAQGPLSYAIKVARDGTYPFTSRDVRMRLLYRARGQSRFEYGADPSQVMRAYEGAPIPAVSTGAGATLQIEPIKSGFENVPSVPVRALTHQIDTTAGPQRLGVLVYRDGQIFGSDGTAIDGDLILLALHHDGSVRLSARSKAIYCMNCDVTNEVGEKAEFAVVVAAPGQDFAQIFPPELARVYAPLSPPVAAPAPRTLQPGFRHWGTFNDVPIPRPSAGRNPGP